MLHGLAYWLGLTSPNSQPYLFWSGIGTVIKFGAVLMLMDHLHWRRNRNGM